MISINDLKLTKNLVMKDSYHENNLVVLDVLWQSQVVKLGLPRIRVCLDKNLPNLDILANLRESFLHCLPGSQNRHPTDLLHRATTTLVLESLWC